ncbi:low molecular weight protein-tyrosine-phosphatase [Massilia antarctica]|uniref:low molecular weight protein-tyrosine-phosphatase n=1 Tax=Massilia antarctica TaxID=2765360 RepID=UPI0006BB858A|nr:low molecular weight protein-tyrosine-phosphatase [Massilia sp. H27-R4]MCY0911278.1 low molecular weight phosphotyrosine protein phosphatase [Massilia sp. H27-R4]CUI05127.1 Low molecular weight protein tyrosine phosphatase [Janthinobacterium sp. CG23_2]CUU28913.1 Low molecular weight protein tyrosine phosphatase [Janthinobacterium sp. CG23_2]
MTKKIAILFVCMANYCRSPTAEGVFRSRAAAAGLEPFLLVDSAATSDYRTGHAPDPRSSEHAARRGIDLSGQRARQVTQADFENFDHIYAMDRQNLAMLMAACPPRFQHKLGLLMEFATRSDADVVPDPYGGEVDGFELVLDYIEDASDGLIAGLRERIGRD